MSSSLRSVIACVVAAAVGSACVTSDRTGPTQSQRIDVREEPIDRYTYRIDAVEGVRPRGLSVRVSRSRACRVTSRVQKTYNVTTSVEWPDWWMWAVLTAGVGGAVTYVLIPPLFGDDSLPEDEQPFPADDPLLGALLGASFALIFATFFPTGTDRSTSQETEVDDAPAETKDVCSPFTPAPGAEITLALDADGSSHTLTTGADGRAELEIDTRAWAKSVGRARLASARLPGGQTVAIDMTSALNAHAKLVVERAKQQQKPPRLAVFAGLEDPRGNGDGVLDAGETAELVVRVENGGGGTGYEVTGRLSLVTPKGSSIRLGATRLAFGEVAPGQSVVRRVEIVGAETLGSGTGEIAIELDEEMGFGSRAPANVRFETKTLRGPEMKLAAYEIFDGESAWAQGDGKRTIGPGEQIELRLRIANVGPGASRNVQVRGRSKTNGVSFVREQIELGRLGSGQAKTATLVFRVTNDVKARTLEIDLELAEQRAQFTRRESLTLPLEQQVASTKVIDVTQAKPGASACPDASAWVLAVMNMRGSQDDGRVLEAMTRQLRTSATERRLKVVSSSAQDQELERLVNEAKAESFKECYDEACQVELGKALAASHLLVSSLERFGGQCTVAWEILELKGETTVCGSSQRGRCDDAGLLESLDAVRGRLPAGH